MEQQSKKFFWTSFALTLGLGLVFLFTALPQVQATDVNVTSLVGAVCAPDDSIFTNCGPWSDCTSGARSRDCEDNCGNDNPENGICGGGVIIPPPNCGTYSCTFTPCVDGTQQQTCGDDCSSTTITVDCGATCGDGIIGAGEQCDDTSACCVSCSVALVIQNINDSVAGLTAAVTWSTSGWESDACVLTVTTSLIEWGQNGDYAEGSANLSGSSYSYNITSLIPDAIYTYRITATDGSLTDVVTGSFNTFGAEICDNGIDDDGDGLIDIADNDCPCTALWDCNVDNVNDAECIDSQQVKTCTQDPLDLCWDTSNNPTETIGCDLCTGVTCSSGQTIINTETCECGVELGVCGNNICEPSFGEDPITCPQDCKVDCISSWQCDSWQPPVCPSSGIQSQNCVDLNDCLIPINPPPPTRTCGNVCPGLTCGVGQTINTQLCTCEAVVPWCGNAVCESGENFFSCPADCIEECTPNWLPSIWGPCVNGTQQRNIDDLNNCNLNLDKPPTIRSCDGACEPEVACGLSQNIDLVNCKCIDIIPFCGNSVCEANEFTWSCPVDCGLPPEFRLRLTSCLDGLDNDKDGLVDYPADPGCASPSDNSELNLAEVLENIQKFLTNTIFDNEEVEAVNQAAAPVVITVIAINTFASFSFFNLLSYLRYFVSQPFAALFRRKRKRWGVVYNALTKRPVDLAIVRLYDNQTKRIVQSRVTDRQGRYSFLAQPGRYYITVTKPKFDFPSDYLKDEKEDIKYLDIYLGAVIEVTEKDAAITANIPIDSQIEEKPVGKVIFQHYLRKVQYVAAFSAIPLAVFSVAISPGLLTFSLLGFHMLLYVLFRRLGYQKKPKSWGVIYDKTNKKPLGRAIARIYDKKYNKLLETRVTDTKGRYAFLVNNNIYVVTAEKLGYKPFKTGDIDLAKKDVDTVVDMDIGLNKAKPGEAQETLTPTVPSDSPAGKVGMPATPSTSKPGVMPEPKSLAPDDVAESLDQAKQPQLPPHKTLEDKPSITESPIEEKIDELSVTRESLEDLVKQKEEVVEIKEEIDEKQVELEVLEDKVEKIGDELDERIDQKSENKDQKTESGKQKTETKENKSKDLPPKKPDQSIFG